MDPIMNARADKRGLVPRRANRTRGYYAFLPMPPTGNSLIAARTYYGAICLAIDHAGWTRGEWAGLRRLERRWRARVNGEDARWSIVGAKPGRLVSDLERAFKPASAHPEWTRPLEKGEVGDE